MTAPNYDSTVTIAVLRLLLTAKNKAPVTYKIIEKYLKHEYSSIHLYNALERLSEKKYISKVGRKKSYKYSITHEGINFLDRLDRKAFLKNMETEIGKYLHILNGVVDT